MGIRTTAYSEPDATILTARKMIDSRGATPACFGKGLQVGLDKSANALSRLIGAFGAKDRASVLMYELDEESGDMDVDIRCFESSDVACLSEALSSTPLQDRLLQEPNESEVYPFKPGEMQSEGARSYLTQHALAFQDFLTKCVSANNGIILVTA